MAQNTPRGIDVTVNATTDVPPSHAASRTEAQQRSSSTTTTTALRESTLFPRLVDLMHDTFVDSNHDPKAPVDGKSDSVRPAQVIDEESREIDRVTPQSELIETSTDSATAPTVAAGNPPVESVHFADDNKLSNADSEDVEMGEAEEGKVVIVVEKSRVIIEDADDNAAPEIGTIQKGIYDDLKQQSADSADEIVESTMEIDGDMKMDSMRRESNEGASSALEAHNAIVSNDIATSDSRPEDVPARETPSIRGADAAVSDEKARDSKLAPTLIEKRMEIDQAAKETTSGERNVTTAPKTNGDDQSRDALSADGVDAAISDETSKLAPTQTEPRLEIVESEKESTSGKTNIDTVPTNGNITSSSSAMPASAVPPPPVLKGTLSYNLESRRHVIRGMWNYENSTVFPPQRFELIRSLSPGEDIELLPTDGEFHGSFSLAYFHLTSKGKQKERSKMIPESGVKITFTPVATGEFKVDGKGTNQFGVFHINGSATRSSLADDPTLNVVLRKRYEPSTQAVVSNEPVVAAPAPKVKETIKSIPVADEETGPLPPPSQSFPAGVVCLQGKLSKEVSNDLGITDVVHKIQGLWAAGLDFITVDPDNAKGLLCRFEYEHKSSVPTHTFPVSGRYSGWFELRGEDGSKTRINERDVMLKFRNNNAGFHNVEGKGSNVFGKYSITGSLTQDHVITIFRHFMPRKIKSNKAVTSAPPPINVPQARRPSQPGVPVELKLDMEDVTAPPAATSGEGVASMAPPTNATYSAVSRGILRVNEDGSHSCQGKWAVTREHFTNGQTSNFTFRLESHFAQEAASASENGKELFPLDSAMYKGSFQLKKQGSRYQTVVDQQIVMKFRLNAQGSYNIYGKGINAIGEFNLMGTLIMSGKSGGQLEVYRMYPPERLANPVPPPKASIPSSTVGGAGPKTGEAQPAHAKSSTIVAPPLSLPGPPNSMLVRRESTRAIKLPSKLEDDDPEAQLSRTMEKCASVLRVIREKDVELGAYFSEPVDPVALGIPTYHQVIKEPMDLKTIQRRLDLDAIGSPEEFARLCRLVFENAMTFNIDPAHTVHQSARTLLIQFNQKYRDIERILQNIKGSKNEKKRLLEEKKRKRDEPPKSLKRQRLEEAQSMSVENARSLVAIASAAPQGSSGPVSRAEFSALYQMMEQLQRHIVQTHLAVADLSPGDENDPVPAATTNSAAAPYSASYSASVSSASPERKKPAKRKAEAMPAEASLPVDDETPLTLDEQEVLTETINTLQHDQLGGIIQIIREAAPVGADEDEIDLEIDQLDHKTQRKLFRHVSKFVKKSKPKPKKKQKTNHAARRNEKGLPVAMKSSPKAQEKPPKAKPAADSFFAFGQDNSDSDSDDEEMQRPPPSNNQGGGKQAAPAAAAKDFKLGDGLHDLHGDDDNDDEDDDIGSGGLAASWNISKPTAAELETRIGEDDDAWGAAREEAAAAKARETERRAREEKMKAEAESAKQQRLADAAARGEEIRAQRAEEAEEEARLKEQQEKEAEEARKKARGEARAKVQAVERTVDLDAQRDIMKEYEQSFLDKDLGSASPSSDFGF